MVDGLKKNSSIGVAIGDKIKLLPHRLLDLGQNKIAVISENTSGWCVCNKEDYMYMHDFLFKQEVTYNKDLGENDTDLVKSLWNFGLLEKNGTDLSRIVSNYSAVLLVVKVTGHCNFSCSYCYDYDKQRESKVVSADKVKELIVHFLAKKRNITLVFHGGEPLLYYPLIKDIVEFSSNLMGNAKRIVFCIQTNGSMFNPEVISFLEKYDFRVGLSLDGMTEHTNGHRVVKSGKSCLEIFKDNLVKYGDFLKKNSGVVCTLSKRNVGDMPNFILWLQELGVLGITLSPLFAAGKATSLAGDVISGEEYVNLLAVLVDMVKRGLIKQISIDSINKFISSLIHIRPSDLCHANPCGAGDNFVVLDANGDYRGCDCLYDDYFLLDNDKEKLLDKRTKVLGRIEYMKGNLCANCALFGFCGGGCVSEAMSNNGTERSIPDLSCSVKKFFYKMLLKEYAFDEKRYLFEYYANLKGAESTRHICNSDECSTA